MNFYFSLYNFSNKFIVFVWFILLIISLSKPKAWKKHYVFFSSLILITFVFNLYSLFLISQNKNNIYLDYIFVPIEFSLIVIYLSGVYRLKIVWFISLISIALFVLLQILIANGISTQIVNFNTLGIYVTSIYIVVLCLFVLKKIFKEGKIDISLFKIPDLWLVATICIINSLDLIHTALVSSSYFASNDNQYFLTSGIRNILKIILMTGYIIGFKKI